MHSLDNDPHLVGMVAAVNGKIVAADIFGDPGLFRKLWPKLLRSYAADAAENAPGPDSKSQTVTAQQGKDFLVSARNARSRAVNRSGVSATLRLESKEELTCRLVPGWSGARRLGGVGGGGMGGYGGTALHENVLGK